MQATKAHDTRITIPPPFIFGVPFGVGLILQWIFPLHFPQARGHGLILGVLCIVPAVCLLKAAHRAFQRAGTSMLPNQRARALIVDGPFRFTRNPLYVGLILFYAGASFCISAAWPIVLLPVVVIGLRFLAISPEERYLKKTFNGAYHAYMGRVRRWL